MGHGGREIAPSLQPGALMRLGSGIRPSFTSVSNREGEMPMYAAACSRDRPRGGRDWGRILCGLPTGFGIARCPDMTWTVQQQNPTRPRQTLLTELSLST